VVKLQAFSAHNAWALTRIESRQAVDQLLAQALWHIIRANPAHHWRPTNRSLSRNDWAENPRMLVVR